MFIALMAALAAPREKLPPREVDRPLAPSEPEPMVIIHKARSVGTSEAIIVSLQGAMEDAARGASALGDAYRRLARSAAPVFTAGSRPHPDDKPDHVPEPVIVEPLVAIANERRKRCRDRNLRAKAKGAMK